MILLRPSQIYISSANVDMRKSIDELAAVVTGKSQLCLFEDTMFVFHNRNLDKIKILYWDREGFCLLYKRMERGRFHFPRQLQEEVYPISEEKLE
jgi:transposase